MWAKPRGAFLKNKLKMSAAFLALIIGVTLAVPAGIAQDILQQDKDKLLEGFDVDQQTLSKYPEKCGGNSGVVKMLALCVPTISVGTKSGARHFTVRAPFVKVRLDGSKHHIAVRVPFVRVDTSIEKGIDVAALKLVSVKASTQNGLSVKAPLVKLDGSLEHGLSLEVPLIKFNPLEDTIQEDDDKASGEPATAKTPLAAKPVVEDHPVPAL